MLENFIFSISIATPIFCVMCIGYMLKKKRVIDNNFIKTANIIIFNVALPIKLFNDVSKTSFDQYFDVTFISFIILGTVLSVVIIWILALLLIKKKSQIGAFIHSSFRGNFLYIGLSLMENITGAIGLKAPLAIAIIIPLYNILAIIILTSTDEKRESKVSIKGTIYNIAKNPLIIAIFMGAVVSLSGLALPVIITRTMSYFKALATPLALITIGASFNLQKSVENLGVSFLASAIKLVIIPLIAVSLAIGIGFQNDDILLIYVLFGVPSATISYIMTAAMNGDKDLSANIIMITTILSVFSMTLFVFFFKTIGII
ncbi:AEC family transporter [Clostridium sediminicola]|uniref:AEC family transporter n=1 Tax=Clostridium sediminicola TaxID=3114879 RepID=UPI0031F2125C